MTSLFALFAFVITILHGAKCNVRYECPGTDLGPCKCVHNKGGVFLQCSKLSSNQELAKVVKEMSGYGINQLEILNSKVSFIPYHLFVGSPVSRIVVKNCSMFYLFNRELDKNAEHVTGIELENVDFEGGLDWTVLENMKSLKTMAVYQTNVGAIPYPVSNLELPLENLVLGNNSIDSVYETAFQNLKKLMNLKLSGNLLKQYQRSMLPLPTSGVQFLDLSFNKLESLPADAFDGMPDLHSLLLRGNLFKALEKSYMNSIFASIVLLDVAQNPLLCNCELNWVLSETKPLHFLGECTSTQTSTVQRKLKELTKEDFAQCS